METLDKVGLIKKIIEYHPASEAGIRRGWSYYIGGMRDTGDWNFRKLLDVTDGELNVCLNELEKEYEPKPDPIFTEQEQIDMNTWIHTPTGVTSVYDQKRMKQINDQFQMQMLWGKQKR